MRRWSAVVVLAPALFLAACQESPSSTDAATTPASNGDGDTSGLDRSEDAQNDRSETNTNPSADQRLRRPEPGAYRFTGYSEQSGEPGSRSATESEWHVTRLDEDVLRWDWGDGHWDIRYQGASLELVAVKNSRQSFTPKAGTPAQLFDDRLDAGTAWSFALDGSQSGEILLHVEMKEEETSEVGGAPTRCRTVSIKTEDASSPGRFHQVFCVAHSIGFPIRIHTRLSTTSPHGDSGEFVHELRLRELPKDA